VCFLVALMLLTFEHGGADESHPTLKEVHMKRDFEQKIILTCKECGEKLILLGPEEDWRSRHAVFMCEFRHKLSLEDHGDEEILAASYTD
jgi:hypothetical protein